MPLPQTIRTTVSQAAINKVGRLFNGTVSDVLNELLQNARRAGATGVEVETLDLAGHPTLVIRDDGRGIDDPAALVTLGHSGWDATIAEREDPAGMGMFSLAGHRVEIRSRSSAAGQGWRVIITPDAWESSAELMVEPFDHADGTELLIDMPEAWERKIDHAIASAARHYPVPVHYQGKILAQVDWLQGAAHIEIWRGSRIGVFKGGSRDCPLHPRINFHGLTVPCVLPSLSEVDGGHFWGVRVDIGDTPELQLVLPARKEMVENAALEELRLGVQIAIYRAIAAEGSHRLSFNNWSKARAAGVMLPEAESCLFSWAPRCADSNNVGFSGERLTGSSMIVMSAFSPDIDQSAALVLDGGQALGGALVEKVSAFEGYGWYDALRRVSDLRFRVERDGGGFTYDDESAPPIFESGLVKAILLDVEISDESEIITLPAEILVAHDEGYGSDPDDATVYWCEGATITPPETAELLEAVCFSPYDDSDCDSWETQRERFRRDAEDLANRLLLSEEDALLARMRAVLDDHAQWLVPEGRSFRIALNRDRVEVALADAGSPVADAAG
jgi:hypothetical protein